LAIGHCAPRSIRGSPEERRSILHGYVEPNEEDRQEGRKVPTAAHHAIAQLVSSGIIRVIVTLNFDRLMENALRERGVEPTVVSSVDSLAGAEPLTHSQCYLLKLHGDYKDARILNTDSELSFYPEAYNKLVDRILGEHGLIVCGWSGEWDHALRAAFQRAPNRRYPTFWAARSTLSTAADDLARHRRATVISIAGADEFFEALQQRIETLAQTRRQNPLNVELLVNSAKRFLAKPEFRIQLDELFSGEVERLFDRLDTEAFSPNARWGPEQFQLRVGHYESSVESLARMVGVLGRWGDGSEFQLVVDIVRGLCEHAEEVRAGNTGWLYIRSYPAVLVFTAYGLGLTRAQRWQGLYRLFSFTVVWSEQGPRQLVSALFLQSWKGFQMDWWHSFSGQLIERHR
jgi:hypothetical protein